MIHCLFRNISQYNRLKYMAIVINKNHIKEISTYKLTCHTSRNARSPPSKALIPYSFVITKK